MVSLPSQHNVATSLDRLAKLAQERGMTVFARVDHSGDAQKVGLPLRLFVANPTLADDDERVYVNPELIELQDDVALVFKGKIYLSRLRAVPESSVVYLNFLQWHS